ncbi:interferon regulatory factor [Plakobranchus ocellatus]|uniref:Interferon regulatory factor n=1 Tax=Plakobranchus ocellatus TaxID=259542 RepID=A0AAV4DZE3_9GAST|nr:interferon regulatory factor [Plakobranchus ocellatus]
MNTAPESRMKFSAWLLQKVSEGSCPGLEWLDKEQMLFRVPWFHYNRSEDVSTDFQIFREWAAYTGSYGPGDVENYPKWKTNFRCAIRKVPDIAEVKEMHSNKFEPAPFRVYRFVRGCGPTPPSAWGQDFAKTSDTSMSPHCSSSAHTTNDVMMTSSSSDDIEQMSEEPSNVLPASSLKREDIFLPPCPYGTGANIPNIVIEPQPHSDFCQSHQNELEGQGQSHGQLQERDSFLLNANNQGEARSVSGHDNSAVENLENRDTVFFEKAFSSGLEKSIPGQEEEREQRGEESMSIPSDLRSVKSDDLFTGHVSFSSSASQESGRGEELPYPECFSAEHAGFTITAFYGSHQEKVFERSLHCNDKSCRIFFGKPKAGFANIDERIYGPPDAIQLELPDAGECSTTSVRQMEYMDAILQEMHRGVVLSIHNGDIYAKRLCRTRAFVYDHNKLSWPLSRKSNLPEKIFDFQKFKIEFDRYKKLTESSATSCSGGVSSISMPASFVYLTFGHRLALEVTGNSLSKVLVTIMVKHTQAEQMKRSLQSNLRLDDFSSDNFLSSRDTIDKMIASCSFISIE